MYYSTGGGGIPIGGGTSDTFFDEQIIDFLSWRRYGVVSNA